MAPVTPKARAEGSSRASTASSSSAAAADSDTTHMCSDFKRREGPNGERSETLSLRIVYVYSSTRPTLGGAPISGVSAAIPVLEYSST